MEQTFIKEIIALFSNSNITELILEEDNSRIICRKEQIEVQGSKNNKKQVIAEVKNETSTMNSPIVGSFYSKPSPTTSSFVQVGDEVEIGDKIGIIEAMKVMNEIKATRKGKILKCLVNDGEMVQVGQALFEIEVSE